MSLSWGLCWRYYWMSDPSPLLWRRCCFPAANFHSEKKTQRFQIKKASDLIQGLRLYSKAYCAQSRLEASITSGVVDLNPKERHRASALRNSSREQLSFLASPNDRRLPAYPNVSLKALSSPHSCCAVWSGEMAAIFWSKPFNGGGEIHI